jgi:hypothetical protein
VDAISGIYVMSKKEIEALKAVTQPILNRLYPEHEEGFVE